MKTRIKELRQSKKLTQTALAIIVGCSQNTISRIELEEAEPTASILIEVSNYFNVSIDYILYRTEYKNYNIAISRADLPPRISEYASKLRFIPDYGKEAVYTLIDHFSIQSEGRK